MNSFINTLINTNFNTYFTTYLNTKEHEEVLDPFCCIIKLCLLSVKPFNTKISINNNSISYQEPSLIQSAIRWKNGDKREHIHNLYNPINKFLLWYDLNDEKIKYILDIAIKGLQKLLDCYNNLDSVTVHSLQLYINVIRSALNNNTIENNISDSDVYYIKFKHLWDDSQINIVYNLLLEIIKFESDKQQLIYIDSLELIINEKEKLVHSIVNKVSTSL
jgi:hypothetical protein